MRAITIWIFSKIVMLIFLFLVFSTVVSFVRMTSERVAADAASSLAMQIRSGVWTAINSPALASRTVIPLPKTLPEEGGGASGQKKYTVVVDKTPIGSGPATLSIAVTWGTYDAGTLSPRAVYSAASALMMPAKTFTTNTVINSEKSHFFVITKSVRQANTYICLQGCGQVLPALSDCVPASCGYV